MSGYWTTTESRYLPLVYQPNPYVNYATMQWDTADTLAQEKGGHLPQVESLAERTGGRFFEARDAGAVSGVYEEIDSLTKIEFAEPHYEIQERFLPFLVVAVALLLLGRLLESRVLAVLP